MAAYARISLGALKARLTERLGGNSTFWTDREKGYALNEAVRVWGALTGQWKKSIPLATTGDVIYDTPRQIISMYRMRRNTDSPMDLWSLFELDNGVTNWQRAASGTPLAWTPIGVNKFAIYPPAAAGGTLWLDGIQRSPTMSADGDFIDLGDEEIGCVLDYSQHYLDLKQGGLEHQASRGMLANFIKAAARRNARLGASAFFRKYLGLDRDELERVARTKPDVGAR